MSVQVTQQISENTHT